MAISAVSYETNFSAEKSGDAAAAEAAATVQTNRSSHKQEGVTASHSCWFLGSCDRKFAKYYQQHA